MRGGEGGRLKASANESETEADDEGTKEADWRISAVRCLRSQLGREIETAARRGRWRTPRASQTG